MTVEMWRDSMLQVANTLQHRGGPSMELDDPSNTRRTVFARVSRLQLDPMLLSMDYPDANVHAADRSETTTPLQKLYAMNSPFAIEQAQKVIQNMHPHPSKIDQEDGLDALFRQVLSRNPDTEERALVREYLHGAPPHDTMGESRPGIDDVQRNALCRLIMKRPFLFKHDAMHALSRRSMLQRSASGFGLQSGWYAARCHATSASGLYSTHTPRAKRVIFLFMNGGPSHVDTFDPKPSFRDLRYTAYGDLYKSLRPPGSCHPLAFQRHGRSGIHVSESLPNIAKVIDECCVIRSMHTDVPNHEPALLQMHTGNIQPIRPPPLDPGCFMAWEVKNENLPGYVVLRPSPTIVVGPALWSNSFLPAKYQATSILTSDLKVDRLIRHIRNPIHDLKNQRQQLDLVQALNRRHQWMRSDQGDLEAQIQSMEVAYRMQMQAADTMDLEKEPSHIKEMYGTSTFGQSRLMARRWWESGRALRDRLLHQQKQSAMDTHSNHNQGHTKLCNDSDQATAALITDLKQRGLLDYDVGHSGVENSDACLIQRLATTKKAVGGSSSHRFFNASGGWWDSGWPCLRSTRRARHARSRQTHACARFACHFAAFDGVGS